MSYHPRYCFPESLISESIDEKKEYFSKKFHLEHQRLLNIKSEIQNNIFKHSLCPIVAVIGPTGIGKTELAKDIYSYVYSNIKRSNHAIGVPACYLEVTLYGGDHFLWKDFYMRILEILNAPSLDISRAIKDGEFEGSGRIFTNTKILEGEVRKYLEKRIIDSGVAVIILDEVNNFFQFSEKNTAKSLDMIKDLSNKTGCQFVLLGAYEAMHSMRWSAQLMRRVSRIHFSRYDWNVEDDRKHFISAYSGILAHVPFHLDNDLLSEKSIKVIYQLCCGCIGVLKELIERAVFSLSETETLNYDKIFSASLPYEALSKMAYEIVEGEEFFRKSEIADVSRIFSMDEISSSNSSINNSNKKLEKQKSIKKVGVRRPVRDKTASGRKNV